MSFLSSVEVDNVSDNTSTTITFNCSTDYRQSVKLLILEKGIKNFQEGYFEIFQLGLEQFKKIKDKEVKS